VSVTVDTNVLLYASDSASPFHERARSLVEELARGPEILYLFWPVLLGYLRIATHPSVFARPLGFDVASGNVAALLSLPHVRAPGEAEGFWPVFQEVTASAGVKGNLVPDAQLAALVRQHEVGLLWTHDRDFRRFDGIRLRDPFTG
jgi:toxin-antitoxin system PIN domain toxin